MAKRSKTKKIFLTIFFFLLLAAAVVAYLFYTADEPPVAVIDQARQELSNAEQAEAKRYAPVELAQAMALYDSARNEWQLQNKKYFFLRKFDKVRTLAMAAIDSARTALTSSLEQKNGLHQGLAKKMKTIESRLRTFEKKFSHLPLKKSIRDNYTNAHLRYVEAEQAYLRAAYQEAGINLDEALRLITLANKSSTAYLENYFAAFDQWQSWANETIAWSKKNKAWVFIADKYAHECYLYKNGSLKHTFKIEMGSNWIGPKLYKGDLATPEGKYQVSKKKSGVLTKYYKALLINYPNEQDKARYNDNLRNGLIPHRGIGNLIEIHGGGGKGVNWTDGCIALTNEEMDLIYSVLPNGTPVTIVGSLRKLNELNN